MLDRPCEQEFAFRGRLGAAPGADDQGKADFLLEQLDLPGQRRLRDADDVRGTREAAVIAHGDEVFQPPDVDARVIHCLVLSYFPESRATSNSSQRGAAGRPKARGGGRNSPSRATSLSITAMRLK